MRKVCSKRCRTGRMLSTRSAKHSRSRIQILRTTTIWLLAWVRSSSQCKTWKKLSVDFRRGRQRNYGSRAATLSNSWEIICLRCLIRIASRDRFIGLAPWASASYGATDLFRKELRSCSLHAIPRARVKRKSRGTTMKCQQSCTTSWRLQQPACSCSTLDRTWVLRPKSTSTHLSEERQSLQWLFQKMRTGRVGFHCYSVTQASTQSAKTSSLRKFNKISCHGFSIGKISDTRWTTNSWTSRCTQMWLIWRRRSSGSLRESISHHREASAKELTFLFPPTIVRRICEESKKTWFKRSKSKFTR